MFYKKNLNYEIETIDFSAIVENCPQGIFVHLGGKILYCNKKMEELLGYDRSKVIGWRVEQFIPQSEVAKVQRHISENQGVKEYTLDIKRSDGSILYTLIRADSMPDGARSVAVTDLTEITKQYHRSQVVFKSISDVIIELDKDMVVQDVLSKTKDLTGYNQGEITKLKFNDFVDDDSLKKLKNIYREIKSNGLNGVLNEHLEIMRKDGIKRWVKLTINRSYNQKDEHVGYVAVARDVTDEVNAKHELEHWALLDHLTGIYNRRALLILGDTQMRCAVRQDKKLLIVYVDVDDMKVINDKHGGHKEGDAALETVTNILRKTFSREMDIVGRVGGDEFAVILFDTGYDSEQNIRVKIKKYLDQANNYNQKIGKKYKLSLSLGFMEFDPVLHKSMEDLMHEADLLMYEQKNQKN